MPMTRAEAVCACTNIIDLVECVSEKAPDDFTRGIHDRTSSMKTRITKNSHYPTITDGMDRALRNMWSGLRKWDHKDEHNDELFYGLDETQRELTDLDGDDRDFSVSDTGDVAGREDTLAGKTRGGKQTTFEEDFDFQKNKEAAISAGQAEKQAKLKAMQGEKRVSDSPAPKPARGGKFNKPTTPRPVAGLTSENIAKERENCISVALNQAHAKNLRVVSNGEIRHGDLGGILAKTKSDRTQQLLHAAFYAGKVAGARMLAESLLTVAKRDKGA